MLAATDATIGFEALVPASRMAWEGAKLSLMAPNRPERRSESVTDNPAKSGTDSIRVHSTRENFPERSTLFSLIVRDGTPILPKQNLKVPDTLEWCVYLVPALLRLATGHGVDSAGRLPLL